MALVTINRVSQKVAATGTGAVALSTTAQTGFRTVAAAGVADASTLYYTIEDGVAWECGLATYTAGTNTIARQVLISSAGNAALNLSLNAVFSATVLAEGLARYLTSDALTPYAKTADLKQGAYRDVGNTTGTLAAGDDPRFTAGGGGAPSGIVNGANGATVTAAAADKGKMYVLAGSGVLSLPAAVQTAGWYAYIKKNDKVISSWSLSPVQTSGAPLIEGLNTLSVYQEEFMLFWDGTGFRTANRPKGWIDVGQLVVLSVATSILFSVGFGDQEIQDMSLIADGITWNGPDVAALRVQKNGSVITTGYNGTYIIYATSLGVGSSVTTCVPLGNQTTNPAVGNAASFELKITNINSGAVGTQKVHAEGVVPYPSGLIADYLIPGAAALQALQILAFNSASLTGGTFNQRIFRK